MVEDAAACYGNVAANLPDFFENLDRLENPRKPWILDKRV